ncbi:MAG TPA: UdgX family uracil-DNA binding protein [Steroidobacteraceae bacterium]|nr:UdgX family uracil-DNA binding protein [Steroidobacteraceae bacterium]
MKREDHEIEGRRHEPEDRGTEQGLTGARTLASTGELPEAVNQCRRCSLWRTATQGVPGEGKSPNALMLVGEAPGDSEDLQGHPFIGPAGAMLDRALGEAGLDRQSVYVTNAVKHFKFEPRGKRRLHVKPSPSEIEACNWWLVEELRLVGPKLVIALGATAARALLGQVVTISQMRGTPVSLSATTHLWVTIHPSLLLRIPDDVRRRAEFDRFVRELKDARQWVARH